MFKSEKENNEFYLAMFMLKKRFNSPIDLVRYWTFSGPCQEDHPSIEKLKKVD